MRTWLLALLALTLAAPAAAEPTLRPVWKTQAGKDAGPRLLAVATGALIAITWDGALHAIEPETGRLLWKKAPETAGGVDRVQVAVDGDVVLAAWPGQAELHGYEATTGKTRWSRKLPSAAKSMVGCDGHHAAVATHREAGTLIAAAFEPATGRPLWKTPVAGHAVGAGAGHVFLGLNSGTGALLSQVEAVGCATGHKAVLPSHARSFVQLLSAGGDRAVTWHFEMGFSPSEICVTALDEGQQRDCFPATDGEVPPFLLSGALLTGDRLYFATHHMEAHNLNPAPDSWLFARALDGGKPLWRSAPLTASLAPVAAGEQLVAAFGSTGADDVARLLDPADGSSLGKLALKKAPTALAADAKRAYVASYDGMIHAFALVRPGATPAPRVAVEPQAMATPQAAAAPLPWRVLTTLDAHPKKARTSGSRVDGTADPVVFADPAGARLAVGGNDDRVRVFDLSTGKRLWRSKGLGKDVQALHAGAGGRLAARIYGGKAFIFDPKGKTKWARTAKIDHGHGWMSGLTASGKWYVSDTFDGTINWHDAKTGKWKASTEAKGRMDRRGMRVRGGAVALPLPTALGMVDAEELREGPTVVSQVPTVYRARDGQVVQAFPVNPQVLLRETCSASRCTVELLPAAGGPAQATIQLDVAGGGWSPSVPSSLDITADGQWLFHFRLGLAPLLIHVPSGRKQPLAQLTGADGHEYTSGRFSADGKRLAVGMHPKPYQVTVLELAE